MFHKLIKACRETWFFWLFFLTLGLMAGQEIATSHAPPRTNLVTGLTFAFLVALWVVQDARRRRHRISYSFPALVFLIWPIFAPLYLFQTRGARALLSLCAFVATLIITVVIGFGISVIATKTHPSQPNQALRRTTG